MKKTVSLLSLGLILFTPIISLAQESTETYTKIMEERKPGAVAAFNKALTLETEGEDIPAIEAYKQAIRVNPLVKESYNNLGAVYADLGIYDQAIENYKMAISLDPSYSVAYYNLGMAYYALARYGEAIEAFVRGGELSAQVKDVLYFTGRAYSHMGDYDKAIESFEAVLEYDQDFYAAHFDLACVYMMTNKFNKALYHFNMVLLLAPHHEHADRIRTIITNIEKLDLNRVEKRGAA